MGKIGSAGGIARGKIEKELAIKNYYSDPNYCKFCGKMIQITNIEKKSVVAYTRKKKFCNQSCNAKYTASHRLINPKKIRICKVCGIEFIREKGLSYLFCSIKCKKNRQTETKINTRTKKDHFSMSINYTSGRSAITRHSRKTFEKSGKKYICAICGYDKYIEICHIIPVSVFSEETTLEEINNIDNLIALCPNHHKELDNGILRLK